MLERVIESSASLRVSVAAAQVFTGNAERLANLVSALIEANPNVPELIGANQASSLRDTHNNRASLLKFVFRLNSWEILARTIFWEYRIQHARGCSYEYFPLEFAAWKRAVQQLEQSCATEIGAVFDWLINQHQNTITLAEAGEGLEAQLPHDLDAGQQAFLAMLLQGSSKAALDLVQVTVHDVAKLQKFYLNVVSPVLHHVGVLWERNEVSVAQEHLATAIVGRLMGALYLRYAKLSWVPGKTALVASGPGELHEVGARMVADFLEGGGWEVAYVGGNLTQGEILSALKRCNPFLLVLSVTSVFCLEGAWQLISAIRSDAETQNARVMLGGFIFNCFPRLWHDFQVGGYQTDAEGAASAANTWWEQKNQ
jgi:methanogenic corrinoid protein MtbC1